MIDYNKYYIDILKQRDNLSNTDEQQLLKELVNIENTRIKENKNDLSNNNS